MDFFWTYDGCDASQEAEIAEAWKGRQAELESKADFVDSDRGVPVLMGVEHNDVSPYWSARGTIYAPQAIVNAEAHANEISEALDHLIGELSQQIDRQIDRPVTMTERRRGLDGFLPFLTSFHREGLSREFISVLSPALGALKNYIRRELRTRGSLGEIPAGETSLQEVMDDVLLKAWDRFARRPPQQPLDVWLVGLIEEVLAARTQPIAEQSLEERQPAEMTNRHDGYRESEEFEAIEQATESETVALASLIAERPDAEPWDRLDIEAKQVRLTSLLRRLPRERRHVLMLQAVEGFSQSEIADLQNRSSREVAADLTAAKQEVRLMFTDRDYVEIEENLTRKGLARPRRSHRS